MARSAREIIDDHIGGGQSKLVHYRKQYEGSGQYVSGASFSERDAQLLQSLIHARDVLENAIYGIEDEEFLKALKKWAAFEWGGFFERATFTLKEPLKKADTALLRDSTA